MTRTSVGADGHQPVAASPTAHRSSPWGRLHGKIEGRICGPQESREERIRRVQFTTASLLVVPAGLIWGGLFLAAGEPVASIPPLAYAAITIAGVWLLLRSARFERFRLTQQAAIFVAPLALQVVLGGFVGSGGVILWSFLAVLMALLFGDDREARSWFGGFIVAVVAVTVLQPTLTPVNALPHGFILAFFAANLVAVAMVIFAVLHSFLTDRRKLRALEVAYLEQEMALRESEKMATLGTLAAGMAHELNNPAAAARRGLSDLRAVVGSLQRSYRSAVAEASPEQASVVRLARSVLDGSRDDGAELPALERSEREEAVEDWLRDAGVDPGEGSATEALVSRGIGRLDLERAAGSLAPVARRLFAACLAREAASERLLSELEQCLARVSAIVQSMRSYTFLDRAPEQEVDIVAGLEDTIEVLRSRLDASGVAVERDYGAVPRVSAAGSALNQVWTNLIQNALDAMENRGTLTLRTRAEDGRVLVEIEDTGSGMSPEVAARAFDPFFTTKPPGAGAGLGLAVARNIVVRQHGGSLTARSEPGRTIFRAAFPVERGPGTV